MTLGLRPSEALQWSFCNHLAMQHDAIKPAAGPSTTNLALAACASCIFVWMLDASGDGASRPKHYVQRYVAPTAPPPACFLSGMQHVAVNEAVRLLIPPTSSYPLTDPLIAPAAWLCSVLLDEGGQPVHDWCAHVELFDHQVGGKGKPA